MYNIILRAGSEQYVDVESLSTFFSWFGNILFLPSASKFVILYKRKEVTIHMEHKMSNFDAMSLLWFFKKQLLVFSLQTVIWLLITSGPPAHDAQWAKLTKLIKNLQKWVLKLKKKFFVLFWARKLKNVWKIWR